MTDTEAAMHTDPRISRLPSPPAAALPPPGEAAAILQLHERRLRRRQASVVATSAFLTGVLCLLALLPSTRSYPDLTTHRSEPRVAALWNREADRVALSAIDARVASLRRQLAGRELVLEAW
jgi:hypothetical protein